MMEEIDYDSAMFSPVGPPALPSSRIATSIFKSSAYPMQFSSGYLPGLAGEYRGFYENDQWAPSRSRYNFPRSSGHHGGVDIYAPLGEPIIAIVDGEVEFRSDADGNGMGNRAHLKFKASGGDWRFVFGHFDRFEGAARSVERGDVIGYAGCTGNAGINLPCAAPNRCGKFSTHVHLQLMRDGAVPPIFDPLAALGWQLGYADFNGVINCEDAPGG